MQGYRLDGKIKHKTIEKIGYLEDLKKLYDDPITYFTEIAKQRSIADAAEHKIEISILTRLAAHSSLRRNLGYAIVKCIYSRLDIHTFFQSKQKHLAVEYNLNSIFSLLIYNRFLFPSSKKKAFGDRFFFFESFDFSLDDLYRSLDYFNQYSQQLQQHLHAKVTELIGRDTQLGYYDVTNYYFEIPYNDEDIYDDKENLIEKGFRRRGPSKEHRPDPIVQMGLLMDSKGIPMAFETFSGGDSEKTSLLPIIQRVKRDYALKRIIAVADRGLNTSDNTVFLAGKNDDDTKGHDGYVYGQSVLGADKEFKTWVLTSDGYHQDKETDKNGDEIVFTHKSRIHAKTCQLENSAGKRTAKMDIYQKQMVYFSQKYAEKQKKERALAIRKAEDLIAHPSKYTKATSYGAVSYVKNIRFSKDTGEIPDGLSLSLNLEKIKEEEKYDGYYSIVTSEKKLSDKKIRDIYKGLWEIEESFKIIKSEFRGRPVYLKLKTHIHAHFLICFVALVIMRMLEHQLKHVYSFKQIRESLIKYSCSHLDENYYLFDYRDDVLLALEEAFGFDFGHKIMSVSEIKNILKYQK